MRPYDALTEEDKQAIMNFSYKYAKVSIPDIKKSLYEWDKNKTTLFKALGNNLRVTFPITEKMNSTTFSRLLSEVYTPFRVFDDLYDLSYELNAHPIEKDKFIHDFLSLLYDLYAANKINKLVINKIFYFFSRGAIRAGKVDCSQNFYFDNKPPLKIQSGSKIIKSIKKIVEYYGYTDNDAFEEWRNKISNIQTKKEIKQNLVISIHPIDYMTMSDNNCGWTSCMSWVGEGCYSLGTIEMMNSNLVAVAYLESTREYKPCNNDYIVPNKSWRSLVYIHKKIMMVGKSYPYYSKELSCILMDNIRPLLKKNLHWKYQYINQKYGDMEHWDNNETLRHDPIHYMKYHKYNYKRDPKHAIWFYTNTMYNDMTFSHGKYWCCRNYVDKTIKICVSGKPTCMHCGNIIEEDCGDVGYFDEGTYVKYCNTCSHLYGCINCNIIDDEPRYRIPIMTDTRTMRKKVCFNCLNDDFYYSMTYNMFIHDDYIDIKSVGNYLNYAVFSYKDIELLKKDMQLYKQHHYGKYYCLNNLSKRIHYSIDKIINEETVFKNITTGYNIYSVPSRIIADDFYNEYIEKVAIDDSGDCYIYCFNNVLTEEEIKEYVQKVGYNFVRIKDLSEEQKYAIINPFLAQY